MTKPNQNVGSDNEPWIAGDPRTLRFTIDDGKEPATPIDLTGATFKLTVVDYNGANPTGPALFTKENAVIEDAVNGIVGTLVESSDTANLNGRYHFQFQVLLGGVPAKSSTGDFRIFPNFVP